MKYINFESKGSIIKFINLGRLDEFDFNIEDIDDKLDIEAIFEELDAFAQSSELDLSYDSISCKTVDPEEISKIILEEDDTQKELSLDDFSLKNIPLKSLEKFLESANIGDVIYLRVERGDCYYRVQIEQDIKEFEIGYTDCSVELNSFELLAKDYYDRVCDRVLPEYIPNSTIDEFKFEPTIIYAKLYRVKLDESLGIKILDKVEIPGYYFLDDGSIDGE